jgi:RNA polymerase subunit RPABC4/transcription elongation factor Spt4
MDQILQQIGDSIGSFAANPIVRLVLVVAAGYVVIVWLASALWAFVDMRRRTGNPVVPYATAGIVILASPLLFPLALLLHVVVRPRETVAESQMSRLRDAALQAELEIPLCPTCRKPVDEDWLICPNCRATLGHRCDRCGRAVGIDWDACGWCGASFEPPVGTVLTDR